MTDPQPRRLVATLALLLLMGGLAFEGLRPVADLDVWWHIQLGEVMLSTGSLVPSDVFSYTRFGTPWPWKDWGTALLLWSTWSLGGTAALVVLKASMLLGTASIQWRALRRVRGLPRSVATLAVALCMSAASFRFTERGATVSLVLVAAVAWLIDRHRAGKRGLLWVVPVVILNANVHRGVLVLPVLLVALATVELVEARVLARARPWRHALLVASLGSLAILATPFGTRIITTTVALMGQHSPLITEWAPVELSLVQRLSPATLAVIPFVVGGGLLNLARTRDPWDAVVVVLALGLGLQSIRHLPYIALLGAGPAATGWASIGRTIWTGRLQSLIAIASATGALLYALGRPLPPPSFGLAPAHYPEKGVAFIEREGLAGPMFNDFGYGGFLIFHLWPEHRVYIDGRTDLVYTPRMVERYIASAMDPNVFAQEADAHRVQFVIVDNSPMQGTFAHLDRNPRWALVQASRRSLIYVRRGGLNDAVADRLAYRWLWPHALERSIIEADRQGHGQKAMDELARMRAEDPGNLWAEAAHRRFEALLALQLHDHRRLRPARLPDPAHRSEGALGPRRPGDQRARAEQPQRTEHAQQPSPPLRLGHRPGDEDEEHQRDQSGQSETPRAPQRVGAQSLSPQRQQEVAQRVALGDEVREQPGGEEVDQQRPAEQADDHRTEPGSAQPAVQTNEPR